MEASKCPSEIMGDPVAVTELKEPLDNGTSLNWFQYKHAGTPSIDVPESGSVEMIIALYFTGWCDTELNHVRRHN